MTWTGRTRRRRTHKLVVHDAAGTPHELGVWVTEHEHEKPDGYTAWRKHAVEYVLQDGRRAEQLTYDRFRDLQYGSIYEAAR